MNLSLSENGIPYHTCAIPKWGTAKPSGDFVSFVVYVGRIDRGGIARGISIKVGNMVPACCERNPGGSIADQSFPEAPVFDASLSRDEGTRYGAEVWAERYDPQPRPAAGGE